MYSIDKSANHLPSDTSSIANLLQSPELIGNRPSTIHTIAFVDPHVADAMTLMANIQADMTVLLDPKRDGVEQITATLSHYQNLTGIEIVSHGSAAQVQLGKNFLDANSLSNYTNELQQWNTALAPGADILFYGCNVAAETTGATFIKNLSDLTGADIAASTNLTGNAAKGGDWNLEYTTGKIDTLSPFSDSFTSNYQGVLTSVFTTQTPDNPNQSDGVGSDGDYELGLEFVSAKSGQIDAVRYYKAPSETGSHIGKIWSNTGTLLSSVAFTNETASGWQQQSLTTPVIIAANTTYVVSVNANTNFAVSGDLATTVNGELSAIADGSNGVFNSTPGLFPTSGNNGNYFRDIVFTPNAPPPTNQPGTITVTGTPTQNQILTTTAADADGLTGVTINYKWQQSANGTTWTDITGATNQTFTLGQAQVNNQVRATASYSDVLGTTENLLGTPSAAVVNVNDLGSLSLNGIQSVGSLITANVADADGSTGVSVNYQWQQSNDNGTTWTNITGATSQTFTLAAAQADNLVRANAIYTDALGAAENVLSPATSKIASVLLLESVFTTQTPDNDNQSDGVGSAGDYELGLQFTSAKSGQINAIRYYKAPNETGPHIGRIWSNTGTLLASVAFANETAAGWQQQSLTTPFSIAANTTYAVSVNANSHFAVSGNAISPPIINGDLRTIANGAGINDTPGLFPTFGNSSNYFRDIVFTPSAPPATNQPGTITVMGTPTQSQILIASVADADGLTGVNINYKWQQSANGTTWTDITGATNQTFTLGQAQVNNQVRATASYSDVLGTTENLLGTPSAAVVNVNDLGSLSLNGIQSVGSIITANVADADGSTGVSVNYQWQQSNDNGTNWTNITGATSQTFTLAAAQADNLVRANAIYTDALGAAENVLSPATSKIASALLLESVFTTQNPDNPNQSDGVGSAGDYELGLGFVSAKAGQINAIRYYKAPSETGPHIGRIWSSTGTLLASVAFANETAFGWQQQSLTTPFSIAANTNYAVSVNANSHFAVSGNAISPPVVNGDLSTVLNGGGFNGTPGLFPILNNSSNYFRDIVFSPNSPSPTNQLGIISVTGTPTQNQILTANITDADGLAGVNINYKWQQSANNGTTWTDIIGATSQTLTLAQPQVNNRVRATATYSDVLGNNESLLGTATTAVVNVNDLGSIALTGAATQNQVLTANVADVDGLTGGTISYKWQQSANNGTTWTNIAGATSKTLTLAQAQVNNRVRANATYTDALGAAENVLSAATTAVIPNQAGVITVSGTVRQNQILTANVTDGNGLTASTIQYKWQESANNGTTWTDIAGATNKTITLKQAQVTKKVRATATYTDALGVAENPLSAASVAVVNVNDVGKVILKGSATVGRSLTETVLDADGVGANIQYVWQQSANNGISWSNIAGATTKSFALTNTQLGKQVRVRTTYVDALGSRENIFSAGTSIAAQNAIVLENQKVGTRNWAVPDSNLAINNEIAGYSDATSINKGQALNLKVSLAQAGQYAIDVYRLGYYNGEGGRLVASATGLNGVTQAAPTIDPTTRMVECKWNTSYTFQTGNDWTSGMYLATLTDSRTGKQSQIEFVVRDDGRPAELGFQEASNTTQAYNNFGGYSTYGFNSLNNQAATKVSFDRPVTPGTNGILAWEYQTARWMESQGYDISYYSNIDVQTNPFQLYSQNAFLSVGHDEYWSMEMRNNVEQARDKGTNLGFFSANSAYWRVRFEPSSTGTANRVMAAYKSNWNLDPIAQADNSLATNKFRSPEVNRPENALLGVMYTGLTNNVTTGYDFVVSNATDPYYAGTGLQNGDKIAGLVGYEWDSVVPNGLTPAGLVILSESPVIPDAGVVSGLPAGTNTNVSNSVRYTAASGAKVFSTGSIQWVWGLDSDLAPNPRQSPVAQKIATNVLADLGAQARTPQIFTPATVTATIAAAAPVVAVVAPTVAAAPIAAVTASVIAAAKTANDIAIKKANRAFVPEEE